MLGAFEKALLGAGYPGKYGAIDLLDAVAQPCHEHVLHLCFDYWFSCCFPESLPMTSGSRLKSKTSAACCKSLNLNNLQQEHRSLTGQ